MAYCSHSRVLSTSTTTHSAKGSSCTCTWGAWHQHMYCRCRCFVAVAVARRTIYNHKARALAHDWLIWIARDLANDWLMNSLWKLVRLCMMSTSNVTWVQCCALALLKLFVLGLNAGGAQKMDWSSLFWDDSEEVNNDIWADGNNVAWLYIWGAYVCPHPRSNHSSWWIAIQSQSIEHFGAIMWMEWHCAFA